MMTDQKPPAERHRGVPFQNKKSMMRKVRSMDSVNISFQIKNEWGHFQSRHSKRATKARELASKFSANEQPHIRCGLSIPIEEKNMFLGSDDHSHFLSSAPSHSLVHGTGTEDVVDELNDGFFGRGMLLGYLSVLCLLFVTFSNHAIPKFDTRNPRESTIAGHAPPSSGSSSSKLGAAALGSLTSIFSPILPFTGGADLRRGEYTLFELLPTSERWDSMISFGRQLSSKILDRNNNPSTSTQDSYLSIPRAGGTEGNSLKRQHRLISKNKHELRKVELSAPTSFIDLDEIGKMSLSNVTTAFLHALHAGREGYDEATFYSKLTPRMEQVLRNVESAVSKSRGDALPPTTLDMYADSKSGDIDALQFCAVLRIFAEWRVLRQVPEGYKGYAMGMGLGQKDVVQNLVKVETAVFTWIEERREEIRLETIRRKALEESGTGSNTTSEESLDPLILRSPTLRELLQDEVDYNDHDGKLPRLKEKSAAMGLLWVRRQLQYQTAIFANVHSGEYQDVVEAVSSAYKGVYDRYHGWAVQKIFNYSFQSAPPSEEIYKIMNPEYLEQVMKDSRNMPVVKDEDADVVASNDEQILSTEEFSIQNSSSILDDLAECSQNSNSFELVTIDRGMGSAQNPFLKFFSNLLNEWDKLGKEWDKLGQHIGAEWNKFAGDVASFFGGKQDDKKSSSNDFSSNGGSDFGAGDVRGGSYGDGDGKGRRILSGEELEKYVVERMTQDAISQMEEYLHVAKSLLNNLADLFEDMNMNDPTRV